MSAIVNGYDYALQVWVINGRIPRCGHPDSTFGQCCNAGPGRFAGQRVADVPGHEERETTTDEGGAR